MSDLVVNVSGFVMDIVTEFAQYAAWPAIFVKVNQKNTIKSAFSRGIAQGSRINHVGQTDMDKMCRCPEMVWICPKLLLCIRKKSV